MGLLDAINLLLACIIGSGIFISARAVLEYSGSFGLSVVVWIGCGLLCIMVWKTSCSGAVILPCASARLFRELCAMPNSAAPMSRQVVITRIFAWHLVISLVFFVSGSKWRCHDR